MRRRSRERRDGLVAALKVAPADIITHSGPAYGCALRLGWRCIAGPKLLQKVERFRR
jgi:hypothetical protein